MMEMTIIPMTKILIHSNHFLSAPDNLGTYNDAPITMQEPGIDWQGNEFNITPPANLKIPQYVRPDPVEDIGDELRFHYKDGYTGKNKNPPKIVIVSPNSTSPEILIIGSTKKSWKLGQYLNWSGSNPCIRIYNNDPAYTLQYGFHICLANLHYRNVLTDFADKSFGNWNVTQSPVAPGYDPASYGIKQFDTYGAQPYSLWIEWPIGKKYEVGAWVEIATEI